MATYEILSKLGEGGMGEVYKALQLPLRREVAVKVMKTDKALDPSLLKRFKREIDACIKLSHPNIVKVYDAGEMDGKVYLAMEYLAGFDPLEQVIKTQGPLNLERALFIVIQLLEALDYCHGHKMIHRDIKPGNLMIGANDRTVLMDFGLVKGATGTLLTREGQVLGSPLYMAPESFKQDEQGPQTDLWAVGTVFYEMLARRKAFKGATLKELVDSILENEPVPLEKLRSDLPPSMGQIIGRFLAKDSAARLPSAGAALSLVRTWQESGWNFEKALAASMRDVAKESVPGAIVPRSPEPRPGRRTAKERVKATGPEAAPPSRDTAGARKVGLLATTIGGLALLGLVAGGVLRQRNAIPQDRSSLAPASVTSALDVRVGADRLGISFKVSPSGVYRVAVAAPSGPPREVLARPSSPGGAVETEVTGLQPGATYQVTVLDESGRILAKTSATTRTFDAARSRVVAALTGLSAYATMRRMSREFEKAHKEAPTAARQLRLTSLRADWARQVTASLRRVGLEQSARDFEPVREAWGASPVATPAQRLELFRLAQELKDLENLARANQVASPSISGRLISPTHGQFDGPRLKGNRGFAYLFKKKSVPGEFEVALRKSTECTLLEEGRSDFFQVYNDLRDGGSQGILDFGTSFFVPATPPPWPDSPVGRAEVRAVLHNTHLNAGIRILTADSITAPATDWKLLAVLRPRQEEPHVVYHTIPGPLVPIGPRPFRVELQFDSSWYLREAPRANSEAIAYMPCLQVAVDPPPIQKAVPR